MAVIFDQSQVWRQEEEEKKSLMLVLQALNERKDVCIFNIQESSHRRRKKVPSAAKLSYEITKPDLLVVGEAAHHGGVNDAAEHHGERVDGQ